MKRGFVIAIGVAGIAIGWALASYWRKRWYQINAPYGKALGYPQCCVQAFCDQPPELLKIMGCTDKDRMRYQAACIEGEYTGFIPCAGHAKKILNGEITLGSLIQNRSSEFPPFPNV